MKKSNSLINKYTLPLFIVLAYLAIDVLLHKEILKMVISKDFKSTTTYINDNSCSYQLLSSSKEWIKGVNRIPQIQNVPLSASGIEMDVYFNTDENSFYVQHDSLQHKGLNLLEALQIYQSRKMTMPIWFDFKNLSQLNVTQSLQYVCVLRRQFKLNNKVIIESQQPKYLKPFCDSNFFTSYYVPYFNPYTDTEDEIKAKGTEIENNLKQYPVTALSGYKFQYSFLSSRFPQYPILTWTAKPKFSLINYLGNKKLMNDDRVKVVLYGQ